VQQPYERIGEVLETEKKNEITLTRRSTVQRGAECWNDGEAGVRSYFKLQVSVQGAKVLGDYQRIMAGLVFKRIKKRNGESWETCGTNTHPGDMKDKKAGAP